MTPSSFKKAQSLREEYSRETDPVMKEEMRRAMKKYFDLDIQESKQSTATSTNRYGLGRVLTLLTLCLLTIFLTIVAVQHFLPDVNVWVAALLTAICYSIVAALVLLVVGRISEGGAVGIINSALGKFGAGKAAPSKPVDSGTNAPKD
jgi:hypothetical protein